MGERSASYKRADEEDAESVVRVRGILSKEPVIIFGEEAVFDIIV